MLLLASRKRSFYYWCMLGGSAAESHPMSGDVEFYSSDVVINWELARQAIETYRLTVLQLVESLRNLNPSDTFTISLSQEAKADDISLTYGLREFTEEQLGSITQNPEGSTSYELPRGNLRFGHEHSASGTQPSSLVMQAMILKGENYIPGYTIKLPIGLLGIKIKAAS